MSEGAGGEGFGGEGPDGFGGGYGIDAAIADIESAAAGSISMGISDISGTAFEGAAASDLGSGLEGPMGAASADLGMGRGGEGGGGEGGGEGRAAPAKPQEADVRAATAPASLEERRQRNVQRAAAAGVTRNDNDAYLLGGVSAKRKDARRVLLGA